jgi:hypothetical protein
MITSTEFVDQNLCPMNSILKLSIYPQRNITASNLLDKSHIGIKEHDVEVLNCMYAFKALPVFEPNNLFAY